MSGLNCAACNAGKGSINVEQEQKTDGFETIFQHSLNAIRDALAVQAKERAERHAFIKKSFASHNAINDALGKINCCDKSKGGLFKLMVAGDELKCVCTNCYRVNAFYIPFVLDGAFGDDVIRQD